MAGQKTTGQRAVQRAVQPSTEASRRAFCLKNYASLRTRVTGLPDLAAPLARSPLGARWADRWEYLVAGGAGGAGAAGVEPGPGAREDGRTLVARVLAAEGELSARCVRFIHAPAAVADRPEARRFLFAAFGAAEEAWVAAAGLDRTGDGVLTASRAVAS